MEIVEVTSNDSYAILSLNIDEMDFIRTPVASDAIRDVLVRLQYPNIILELNNLNYIDSTGLSSLINVSRQIKERNRELVVACSNAKILQLFDIARLKSFFRIFESIDEARRYFVPDAG